MRIIISVAALLSVAIAIPLGIEDKWTQFKPMASFMKHQRRKVKDNLKKIEEHNEKYKGGHVEWYMGVNHFADKTSEEFVDLLAKLPKEEQTKNGLLGVFKPSGIRDYPERLDLRPYLNNVRDQGGCLSCYAFATTATVEAAYAQTYRKREILSPQNIVDCARGKPFFTYGCKGGTLTGPMEYMKDNGIMKDEEYLYHPSDGNCSFIPSKSVLKLKGYTEIPNKETDLISALNEKGILAVAVDAKEWQLYEGGVFYPTMEYGALNHAVVLAGYGTTSYTNTNYWIVRNSWGEWWGEDGNIRLNRNMTTPYHVGLGVENSYYLPVYPEV